MNINNKNNIFTDINLEKSFSDFSIDLKQNDFFVYYYFSTKKASLEDIYQIPKHLLDNKFFITPCLTLNPDICLLVKDSPHLDLYHAIIEKNFLNPVLKYATNKQLSNYSYCLNKIKNSYLNYQYLPDNYKRDKAIYELTFSMNHEFVKHYPFNNTDTESFVVSLLKKYNNIYKHLPLKYKSSLTICSLATGYSSSAIQFFPKSVKENKEFITVLLRIVGKNSNKFHQNMLPHLPTSYFNDKDFHDEFGKSIQESFYYLPLEIRKIEQVILTALKNTTIGSYDQLGIIKAIPYKDLRKQFDIFTKNKNDNKEHHEGYYSLANSYFLNKKLSNELILDNSPIIKKMKI